MSHRHRQWIRITGWIFFLAYLALLIYFLFFAEEYGRQYAGGGEYRYNLIPFTEIRRFWVYRRQVGTMAALLNLGGNVAGFMPFGFLLPVLSSRLRKFWVTVPLGCALSLAVECVQLAAKVGSFDVDDIILNTLGVILGYLLFRLLNWIRRNVFYGKKI